MWRCVLGVTTKLLATVACLSVCLAASAAEMAAPSDGDGPGALVRGLQAYLDRTHVRLANFSLALYGVARGSSATAAVDLASVETQATVVMLEPSSQACREVYADALLRGVHNLAIAHNDLEADVFEAMAHSNEFFDHQAAMLERFGALGSSIATVELVDAVIGQLLSLGRSTCLVLPDVPLEGDGTCEPHSRGARLVQQWVRRASGVAEAVRGSAARAGIDVRVERLARPDSTAAQLHLGADRPHACAGSHSLWVVETLALQRTNRHHFCYGRCKTHNSRSYMLRYVAHSASADVDELVRHNWSEANVSAPLVRGAPQLVNSRSGRVLPYETGSINLHTLVMLQRSAYLSSAELDLPRQHLVMMFLSLPVHQDPAPWNIVLRGGELFPIDVDAGQTYEGMWGRAAQKYIGSLELCYKATLKTLCSSFGENIDLCMRALFADGLERVCPAAQPYPCHSGCAGSFKLCVHLLPANVSRGYYWSASSPHPLRGARRYVKAAVAALPAERGPAGVPAQAGAAVVAGGPSRPARARAADTAVQRRARSSAKTPAAVSLAAAQARSVGVRVQLSLRGGRPYTPGVGAFSGGLHGDGGNSSASHSFAEAATRDAWITWHEGSPFHQHALMATALQMSVLIALMCAVFRRRRRCC